MSKVEFKVFNFETKKVSEDGIIEGYASTFGNVDLGLDIVDKGAFKKTIKENKGVFPILADHDSSKQVGWNLEAEEDSTGLYVKGQLDLNVALAKERHSLAKKGMEIGAKTGLSIGYYTILAAPDQENPRIRHLKEIKLFEYSLVTFPMNTAAMITAAKSLGDIDKAQLLLQSLKESGISLKDLELALRQEAAAKDYDPSAISQSLDNLLMKFKN